jgi:decaprenyl-phosphate phosphoribosyltransferase
MIEQKNKLNFSNIVKLLRIHHYIKNIFIFVPAFFALKLTDYEVLISTFSAFILFSIVASSVYILNDYFDIEEDRRHPKKQYRPLASGAISKFEAIFLMAVLLILGSILMTFLPIKVSLVILIYILLNVAYTLHLKNVAIIDILIIAIGFVLRLFVGALVSGVNLSMWIVIMTFLLSLFIALAKRRDDVIIFMNTGNALRKVINGYNMQFLDVSMAIMASVVIVVYTIYTTSLDVIERVHSEYLYLTTFFVIVGIMRFLQLTFVLNQSGSPTNIILKDKFIMTTLAFWILSYSWILYY